MHYSLFRMIRVRIASISNVHSKSLKQNLNITLQDITGKMHAFTNSSFASQCFGKLRFNHIYYISNFIVKDFNVKSDEVQLMYIFIPVYE